MNRGKTTHGGGKKRRKEEEKTCGYRLAQKHIEHLLPHRERKDLQRPDRFKGRAGIRRFGARRNLTKRTRKERNADPPPRMKVGINTKRFGKKTVIIKKPGPKRPGGRKKNGHGDATKGISSHALAGRHTKKRYGRGFPRGTGGGSIIKAAAKARGARNTITRWLGEVMIRRALQQMLNLWNRGMERGNQDYRDSCPLPGGDRGAPKSGR